MSDHEYTMDTLFPELPLSDATIQTALELISPQSRQLLMAGPTQPFDLFEKENRDALHSVLSVYAPLCGAISGTVKFTLFQDDCHIVLTSTITGVLSNHKAGCFASTHRRSLPTSFEFSRWSLWSAERMRILLLIALQHCLRYFNAPERVGADTRCNGTAEPGSCLLVRLYRF